MSRIDKDNLLGDDEKYKPGRLEKEADIYKKRKTKTAKENTQDMSSRDKFLYFKEYYLKYLILVLVMITVGIYVVYTVTRREADMDLYMGYIDCIYDTKQADVMLEDYANHMGYKYNTADFADDSFLDNQTDNGWLSGYLDDGKLDVLVMNREWFKGYAVCDYLLDLSEYIDVEEYKDYLVKAVDSKGNEKYFGFKCDSIPIYNSSNLEKLEKQDTYVVVLYNSSQIENSIEFLKFAATYKPSVSSEE